MKIEQSTSKIFTIISHEYITKVKTKGFIIGTLLGPILMLTFIIVPVVITMLSSNATERNIAFLDKTEQIGKLVVKADTAKYFLTTHSEESLRKDVLNEKLDGYLLIPKDFIKSGDATVYTRGGGGLAFISKLNNDVGGITRNIRLKDAGADLKVIELVEKGININTIKITETGNVKDYTEAYAIVGYIAGFMIYILMFIYGSFVMRGVIEEKANRIVEVLASSARPFEIMMGKVIGIGAVGLTQVLFWVIISAVLLNFGGSIVGQFVGPDTIMKQGMMSSVQHTSLPAGFELPYISPWLFVAFIFYFLSGYFLYATLFAAVGSAVDQESDAQQLQAPVSMMIVIPILFIGSVISNPDGVLSVVLSLFPFFSPMLMIVRLAATQV
ncbi:MAG: ABC transporter permease, partial [FCB group bacterium]